MQTNLMKKTDLIFFHLSFIFNVAIITELMCISGQKKLRISYSYGLERLPKLHKAKKHSTDS
jgi:hypothetical protein